MTTKTNTRLVFHFYASENIFSSEISEIHFKCLSRYSELFDSAVFIISVDDTNRTDIINYVKNRLIEGGYYNNVTFHIIKNNELRETATFYDFIASKLGDLDGLTFFGHSKGVGNEIDGVANESVKEWIKASYFLNMAFFDEVIELLVEKPYGISYGALKCSWNEIDNANKWIYSGTFFWLNTQRLKRFLDKRNVNIKKPDDRYYSELFCGEHLPIERASVSHEAYYLFGDGCKKWYDNAPMYIDYYLLTDQDKEKYKVFKTEIEDEK